MSNIKTPIIKDVKGTEIAASAVSVRQAISVLSRKLGFTGVPTFAGLTLTDLTASRLTATNSLKGLTSVSNLTTWIGGTTNQVISTSGGDGTITLSTPQDIHAGASPVFTGQTITGNSIFGLNSSVFQPTTDSTTFFQVKNVAGTQIIGVDTTNGRMIIGVGNPSRGLEIVGTGIAGDLKISRTGGTTGYFLIGSGLFKYEGGTFQVDDNFKIKTAANPSLILATGPLGQVTPLAMASASGSYSNFALTGDLIVRTSTAAYNVIITARSAGEIKFGTGIADTQKVVITNGGFFGIGEPAPETMQEITGTVPYLTLHNSTHEDSDGGRESRINFKGEQSGGEETTLARIEVCHDGAADDEKGKIEHYINTGSDGDSPTLAETIESNLDVFFTKIKLTALGGYAIKLTNKTGAVTVAGQLVKADTATNDAVVLAGTGDTECFGVFLDSGIADASEAWVVVSGIADVALDDNIAAVRGNWMATGAAVGYARTSASPAASPQHFEEIGHCIESVAAGGAGTHILARCVLHFN